MQYLIHIFQNVIVGNWEQKTGCLPAIWINSTAYASVLQILNKQFERANLAAFETNSADLCTVNMRLLYKF